MTKVNCKQCQKQFDAKPSWLKKGWGIYCSTTCRYVNSRKGKVVPCHVCGKKSYKQPKALTRSKSGKFFCSKSCQTTWRNTESTEEKHANWKGGEHAYRRIMDQSGITPICRLCKTTDRRVLAVHHIDENRKNNTLENLAWLCHNCHHLVHHHQAERKEFMATIV